MSFADFFSSVRNDAGALIVGGAWAIYVVAGHVMQNYRNVKRQELVDHGATALLASLQAMATAANGLAQEERARADRLTRENMELNAEIGSLRSDLKHCTEVRVTAVAGLTQAQDTIESLVVEIRNKDQSISQLVDLNRKLLQSIGSSIDTLEPVSTIVKEIPHDRT